MMVTRRNIKRAGYAILLVTVIYTASAAEIFYPWQGTYIGALDTGAWPGVVLALDSESAFAFVLRIERDGDVAEGKDFFYLLAEIGPHSPDGQYARLKFDLSLPFKQAAATPVLLKPPRKRDTLTLEWSRRDEKIVLGRITCPSYVKLGITHYFPWKFKGSYALLEDGHVHGRGPGEDSAHYLFWTDRASSLIASAPNELTLDYESPDERHLHFIAGAGDNLQSVSDLIYRYKNSKAIDSLIDDEADGYEQKRVKVKGLFRGAPQAITNTLHWMINYQPGYHRLYAPAGRNWFHPDSPEEAGDWRISQGESLFSALQLSLESSKLAIDAVRAVLGTQYPNGNIPHWRGSGGGSPDRSHPPVGAYIILKLFQKLGDMDFLSDAYPHLQRWHTFWTTQQPNGLPRRDGNNDGLLEWGSDTEMITGSLPPKEKDATGRQRAAWESGQPDLPNWDSIPYSNETATLAMNCLDLNCLFALDSWCLAEIAQILGRKKDADRYLAQYEEMKKRVNEKLWNEAEGFYFDRHWDGRFSTHKAASNFYPLLARIPDESRAQKMLEHLMNPREFWGEYVVPSISRDHPDFQVDNQRAWRGTIWAPTNYLIYQGLKAYGFDAVASEFARKSADLYLRTWQNYQVSPESFNSLTGEAGWDRQQSWGPLLVLIGIEEYLDFNPWEGFRFGMIKPDASGRLSRLYIQGRHYEVEVSKSRTVLNEEGKDIISLDGPAVVRRFLYNEFEVSFQISSFKARELKIRFLKRGKYQLIIDGRTTDVFTGGSCKFEVPLGDHTVLIRLLSDLESPS